jgi:hypothetical protein
MFSGGGGTQSAFLADRTPSDRAGNGMFLRMFHCGARDPALPPGRGKTHSDK